jgi:hypothetical protein
VAAAAILALVAIACAGHRPPSGEPEVPNGSRLLYKAESQTPEGRNRFRVAAAVRPPDHLRLEILGPLGGPRLLLATDGREAIAIDPTGRRYDRAEATAEALGRITGLPLDPAGLVAALQGRVVCAPGVSAAGTAPGGDAEGCRLGDASYLSEGSVRSWPASITIGLPRLPGEIRLILIEGPAPATLGDEIFAPMPPTGFVRDDILGGEGTPALFTHGQDGAGSPK